MVTTALFPLPKDTVLAMVLKLTDESLNDEILIDPVIGAAWPAPVIRNESRAILIGAVGFILGGCGKRLRANLLISNRSSKARANELRHYLINWFAVYYIYILTN